MKNRGLLNKSNKTNTIKDIEPSKNTTTNQFKSYTNIMQLQSIIGNKATLQLFSNYTDTNKNKVIQKKKSNVIQRFDFDIVAGRSDTDLKFKHAQTENKLEKKKLTHDSDAEDVRSFLGDLYQFNDSNGIQDVEIVQVVYYYKSTDIEGHHEIMCRTNLNKLIKFDLGDSYRMIYDAELSSRELADSQIISGIPVSDVEQIFTSLAASSGNYEAGRNTCQTFANNFFKDLTGRNCILFPENEDLM